MSVTVNIKVEDVTVRLVTYTSIQIYSASSAGGSYSLVTTLTLVDGTYEYSYIDSGGVLGTTFYKYRFYNSTGPVGSDYSNPFSVDGATRRLIRQKALKDYKAGYVLSTENSGSNSASVAVFSNYMLAAGTNSSKRAVGTWLYPTSGSRAGQITKVSSISIATPALLTMTPVLDGALGTADEVEWHSFASPDDWNDAINRGLGRYYYLDRIPLVGDGNAEQSLAYLPWLRNRNQIAGLWSYPIANDVERAWGRSGRWWGARQEGGYITLMTKPALQTTDTVYMECMRQMPNVYTDDSVLPNDCDIELAAAFAYDELLSILLNPTHTGAASVDKTALTSAKASHVRGNLRILKHRNKPNPRWQPQQLYEESNYFRPFAAR